MHRRPHAHRSFQNIWAWRLSTGTWQDGDSGCPSTTRTDASAVFKGLLWPTQFTVHRGGLGTPEGIPSPGTRQEEI